MIRRPPNRLQKATGKSVPAPIGGLDTQSALADMKPENAVVLKNWIPRPGYVEMRKGFVGHTTNVTNIETLMVYRSGTGDKIFACGGTTIKNCTSSANAGSTLYSSAGNARWQYVNFANDAGTWLIAVNGSNAPQKSSGAAFSTTTITGSSGSKTLTASNLIDVMAHKRRLYFAEKNTLNIWYLSTDAIAGAAGLLDLGPVFTKGGYIASMGTWTLDGGQGSDDYAVFVTNQGEVAIYQGTDPSDATAWALVGVYAVGIPLSRKSLIKWGADVALLTTDGLVPLSQALQKDRAQEDQIVFTSKIQNAFRAQARSYRTSYGWEALLYPAESLAIVNVPNGLGQQYVMDQQTGSWCEFSGMNATCWCIANDRPYFGTTTGVYRWDIGPSDNGSQIVADCQPAFNYFGVRGAQKRFTMMRPVFQSTRTITPAVQLLLDYESGTPTSIPTVVDDSGSLWGSATWDVGKWEVGLAVNSAWTGATGVGYCASPAVRVSLSSAYTQEVTVRLIGFDVLFEVGGQL